MRSKVKVEYEELFLPVEWVFDTETKTGNCWSCMLFGVTVTAKTRVKAVKKLEYALRQKALLRQDYE